MMRRIERSIVKKAAWFAADSREDGTFDLLSKRDKKIFEAIEKSLQMGVMSNHIRKGFFKED